MCPTFQAAAPRATLAQLMHIFPVLPQAAFVGRQGELDRFGAYGRICSTENGQEAQVDRFISAAQVVTRLRPNWSRMPPPCATLGGLTLWPPAEERFQDDVSLPESTAQAKALPQSASPWPRAASAGLNHALLHASHPTVIDLCKTDAPVLWFGLIIGSLALARCAEMLIRGIRVVRIESPIVASPPNEQSADILVRNNAQAPSGPAGACRNFCGQGQARATRKRGNALIAALTNFQPRLPSSPITVLSAGWTRTRATCVLNGRISRPAPSIATPRSRCSTTPK
jgi:hypothetical protein